MHTRISLALLIITKATSGDFLPISLSRFIASARREPRSHSMPSNFWFFSSPRACFPLLQVLTNTPPSDSERSNKSLFEAETIRNSAFKSFGPSDNQILSTKNASHIIWPHRDLTGTAIIRQVERPFCIELAATPLAHDIARYAATSIRTIPRSPSGMTPTQMIRQPPGSSIFFT